MANLTHEELTGLISSPTWKKVLEALEVQKSAFIERLCFGMIRDTADKTAMRYIEASTEIRMYDEFIHLDELLFGRKGEEDDREDND